MKLKSTLTSAALIIGAVFFITPSPAVAGECSATDPCQTYAMVDGNGTVTNIIVCQPSVCGSGTFAGSRVVPQVAANPVTHQSQGGWTTGSGYTVTESNGVFNVASQQQVIQTDVSINQETNITTVISANFSGSNQTFTYESTIGLQNGQVKLSPAQFDTNTSVVISAAQVLVSDTPTITSSESIRYSTRQTFAKVEQDIINQNLVILNSKMARLQKLLSLWML